MTIRLLCGDALEQLRLLPEKSVDAVVTDPPYGLSFMGKDWDHGIPGEPFWREVLRVAKPGAHLLAFGGTRTFHRLTCAIEDAGWEIRDCLMWVYGSGFPKSLDVSKAIDKMEGIDTTSDDRWVPTPHPTTGAYRTESGSSQQIGQVKPGLRCLYAPATDAARQWRGWGTALKPAWEPIILARKPLEGTVAENVQKWGTGALNIDGCRIPTDWTSDRGETWLRSGHDAKKHDRPAQVPDNVGGSTVADRVSPLGRWPANLIHDGSEEVVGMFPVVKAGVAVRHRSGGKTFGGENVKPPMDDLGYGDSGSAARFFYCAKASKEDRGEGNNHPTVKPTDLMRYLCRLVTPPGGTVLDPFMGSGSTGKAALLEGFGFIGIDNVPEYIEMARRRIEGTAPLFARAAEEE
jgi:site-specific DNA-methyltransferase (adenine-specific)